MEILQSVQQGILQSESARGCIEYDTLPTRQVYLNGQSSLDDWAGRLVTLAIW